MTSNDLSPLRISDDQSDQSMTHRAYVQIRAQLISCQFRPGARIKISQLQRDLGVSQAAAREGLSRLAAEGLVTIERNSGFRASPVSAEGYRELSDACLTIEIPLLQSSMKNGDYAWEGALLSAYHIASRVLEKANDSSITMDEYVENRERFHRMLFSKCDNNWLLWSWSLLYAQQIRYRHTFADLARFERGLHEEYKLFLEAVIERKVEEAVAIWRDHHAKVVAFIESNLHTQVARPARLRVKA